MHASGACESSRLLLIAQVHRAVRGKLLSSCLADVQGKVRRMRPSPFHKGSGADKPAASAPAKKSGLQSVSEGENDDSEVRQKSEP